MIDLFLNWAGVLLSGGVAVGFGVVARLVHRQNCAFVAVSQQTGHIVKLTPIRNSPNQWATVAYSRGGETREFRPSLAQAHWRLGDPVRLEFDARDTPRLVSPWHARWVWVLAGAASVAGVVCLAMLLVAQRPWT